MHHMNTQIFNKINGFGNARIIQSRNKANIKDTYPAISKSEMNTNRPYNFKNRTPNRINTNSVR